MPLSKARPITRPCSTADARTISPALPPQPKPICETTRSVAPMRRVFMIQQQNSRPPARRRKGMRCKPGRKKTLAFNDARRLQTSIAQDFAEHVVCAFHLDADDHVFALLRIGRGERNGLHLHRR